MVHRIASNEKEKARERRSYIRLSPLAAAISAIGIFAAVPAYAADDSSVEELKAEIVRLKRELETVKGGTASAVAQPAAEQGSATGISARATGVEADQPVALDAVVVRSRARIERLQDIPLSVSVVTGAELEREAAKDIGEITRRAANVSWNKGNQRTSSLSIRGVGKVGQTEAQDPSVGIIVDGVNFAYNPLSSSYNFVDVDAVEVTRGPQGTLMGKNSSLGVINIRTKRPTFTPTLDYSLGFGEKNQLSGFAAVGGPIVDGLLAWRGTFAVEKRNGDYKNRRDENDTYVNTDRYSGRVQFLLTPNPDFSARVALELAPRTGENTNGQNFYVRAPATYSNGAAYSRQSDRLRRDWFAGKFGFNYDTDYFGKSVWLDGQHPVVTGSRGASAELNWNFGEGYSLTSITAYRDYHFNARYNDEGTVFDIQRSSGQLIDYKQVSQEFRINSPVGGFVDYQAGLFWIKTHTDIQRNVVLGADAGAYYASNAQYSTLNTSAAGRLLMSDSLNGLWKEENKQKIDNNSIAVFGQANWHFSEPFTVTTGARLTNEYRKNPTSSLIRESGYGTLLNPGSIDGQVLSGGFNSNGTGDLTTNTAEQLANADTLASKYFGKASYTLLDADEKAQVAAAKSIRTSRARNGATLWNTVNPKPFKGDQPAFVIAPTYKINDDITTYVSWQYGEKAGIAQVTKGVSTPVDPERSSSYEWGVKTALLDKKLVFNANVFLTDIRDYQQSIVEPDPSNPLVTISYTGNAPWVRVKGLEIDGVYSGIRNTTLRFAGAYTDARYKDFKNSPRAAEDSWPGAPATADLTGKTLPGAAKFTFNIGGEYRIPVLSDKEFHASFNTNYTSRFNSDNALSDYGWIKAHSKTDISVGLGRRDKSYDVSLIVKNLFDDDTPTSASWTQYTPAVERWIGLVFSGKL